MTDKDFRSRDSASSRQDGDIIVTVDGRKGFKAVLLRPFTFLERHPMGVFIFFVFALYFVTRVIYLKSNVIFSDEAHYVRWAQLARGGNWWFSLLYDGKPPLHAWAIVPFLAIFKDPLVAGRATSVFFGALTTLAMILLGREFRDLKFGALAGLLYVICPFPLIYDRLTETEPMMLAFFVFAVLFAVKAARTDKLAYLAGTAVAAGLALWTKGTALLLYPVVPFAYLARDPAARPRKKRPLIRWLVGVAASLLVGFGILSLLRLSPAYSRRSGTVAARTKGISEIFKTIGDFPRFLHSIFASLFNLMTPVLFVFCVIGLVVALLRAWRPAYFLWIWFVVCTVIIVLISRNYWPRFYLVLVPPVLFGGAYAVYEVVRGTVDIWKNRRKGWQRGVAVYVAVLVAITAGVAVPVAFKINEAVECKFVPGGNYVAVNTDQIVNFLRNESKEKKVTVFTTSRDSKFLARCLTMYLKDYKNVVIKDLPHPIAPGPIPGPRSSDLSQILGKNKKEIDKALAGGPIYVVADSAKPDGQATPWPVELIEKFPYPRERELDRDTVNPRPEEKSFVTLVRVSPPPPPPTTK